MGEWTVGAMTSSRGAVAAGAEGYGDWEVREVRVGIGG